MTSSSDNGYAAGHRPGAQRLLGAFSGPCTAKGGGATEKAGPGEVLPPEERKAVMVSLDSLERKWASVPPGGWPPSPASPFPLYIRGASNKIHHEHGKNTIALLPAWTP